MLLPGRDSTTTDRCSSSLRSHRRRRRRRRRGSAQSPLWCTLASPAAGHTEQGIHHARCCRPKQSGPASNRQKRWGRECRFQRRVRAAPAQTMCMLPHLRRHLLLPPEEELAVGLWLLLGQLQWLSLGEVPTLMSSDPLLLPLHSQENRSKCPPRRCLVQLCKSS